MGIVLKSKHRPFAKKTLGKPGFPGAKPSFTNVKVWTKEEVEENRSKAYRYVV